MNKKKLTKTTRMQTQLHVYTWAAVFSAQKVHQLVIYQQVCHSVMYGQLYEESQDECVVVTALTILGLLVDASQKEMSGVAATDADGHMLG
jgi:hypothetical protein